jgi:uncharacterized membrane protein HdeD (DUF308 family)
MRTAGIILIIVGILMFVFNGFNYKTKKNVADIGPIEINKEESHSVGWPAYAGGIAIVAGIVLIAAGRKKS